MSITILPRVYTYTCGDCGWKWKGVDCRAVVQHRLLHLLEATKGA